MTSLRRFVPLLVLLLSVPMVGCNQNTKATALTRTLSAYHTAIRWGDIELAWQMVDPEFRKDHPMSSIERSRFDQYSVSGYNEQGTSTDPDGALHQVVEITVVNHHTQIEKTLIDQQSWRWDEEAEVWWQTSGLPDFSTAR